jgi:hypothetical protein
VAGLAGHREDEAKLCSSKNNVEWTLLDGARKAQHEKDWGTFYSVERGI